MGVYKQGGVLHLVAVPCMQVISSGMSFGSKIFVGTEKPILGLVPSEVADSGTQAMSAMRVRVPGDALTRCDSKVESPCFTK